MLFVNWYLVRFFSVCITVIALLLWAMWHVRRKKLLIRIPVIAVSIPVSSIAALFILLILAGQVMGCDSHGQAIYSPNGKAAARVETFDGGALGGDTSVTLYTARGLWTKAVFFGGWRSVEDSDLRWINDRQLQISYTHYYTDYDEQRSCSSLGEIQVVCVPKATP